MIAIQIIGRLREKYSNKYVKTPSKDKNHYIKWLQDEYAELAMKQANEAKTSNDRERLLDFMEFAINQDQQPEMSTKELLVDEYLK